MRILIVRISRVIQKAEEAAIALSVLSMATLTITNVVLRSVMGTSLAFAEELTQVLTIIVCFIGLSYAAGQGRHIRMTAIYDQLPRRARKVSMLVICATTCLLLAMMGYFACQYVFAVYQLRGRYPTLGVPFFFVYLFAPLGFLLASLQYALAFVRNIMERDVYLAFDRLDEYEPITPEI
jgi:TRAP-type C4-dicarboxylate transport system permease small subunit